MVCRMACDLVLSGRKQASHWHSDAADTVTEARVKGPSPKKKKAREGDGVLNLFVFHRAKSMYRSRSPARSTKER